MHPLIQKIFAGLKQKESLKQQLNTESQKVYGRKFKHLTYDERKAAGLIKKFRNQ